MHPYHPRSIGAIIAASVALVASVGSAGAQAGVGAKYGARDPRTCANTSAPTSGAPNGAQAAQYLACHIEGEQSYNLYLISDVRVQVGKGTLYRELPGSERPFGGDPDGLVYAIRGSYKRYQCSKPSDYTPAGQNCNVYDEPRATGTCFRDKFGEWVCNMTDLASRNPTPKQPPPHS